MKDSKVSTYLQTLISEKGGDIEAALPQFEAVGHFGLCYLNLVEFISTMPKNIQEQIRKALVHIDFINEDVFEYLNHLTNGMIKATNMDDYAGLVETKYDKV